jgi:hypothetical protein
MAAAPGFAGFADIVDRLAVGNAALSVDDSASVD